MIALNRDVTWPNRVNLFSGMPSGLVFLPVADILVGMRLLRSRVPECEGITWTPSVSVEQPFNLDIDRNYYGSISRTSHSILVFSWKLERT